MTQNTQIPPTNISSARGPIEVACDLIDFALQVKEHQLRQAHPEADDIELRRMALALFADY